eukprot:m.77145 g.77145  ORF g.77145 m.77145 type:complete len:83 (+) comp12503_c0_seq1:1386-1634(+)
MTARTGTNNVAAPSQNQQAVQFLFVRLQRVGVTCLTPTCITLRVVRSARWQKTGLIYTTEDEPTEDEPTTLRRVRTSWLKNQ